MSERFAMSKYRHAAWINDETNAENNHKNRIYIFIQPFMEDIESMIANNYLQLRQNVLDADTNNILCAGGTELTHQLCSFLSGECGRRFRSFIVALILQVGI